MDRAEQFPKPKAGNRRERCGGKIQRNRGKGLLPGRLQENRKDPTQVNAGQSSENLLGEVQLRQHIPEALAVAVQSGLQDEWEAAAGSEDEEVFE